MEHKYLFIPWGGQVVSDDGWSGRLRGAYLAPRSQQISHILARRGILRRSAFVKLDKPNQDADGSLLLAAKQTDNNPTPSRGSVPFTSRTVVHCSDGASLPLRGLILDQQRLRVEYLLVGSDGDARAVPMNLVDKLASGAPSIALGKADMKKLPFFRPDAEAQRNAVAALGKADPSGDTLLAVHVQVVGGTACVTGNVRLPVQKAEVERAVASAKGVLNVQSGIATDWDLSISIAQAMAQEGLTRHGLVTVNSSLGRIRLSGHLAIQELADRAVAIATGVAGVRSVAHDIQVRPLPAPEPAAAVITETP